MHERGFPWIEPQPAQPQPAQTAQQPQPAQPQPAQQPQPQPHLGADALPDEVKAKAVQLAPDHRELRRQLVHLSSCVSLDNFANDSGGKLLT